MEPRQGAPPCRRSSVGTSSPLPSRLLMAALDTDSESVVSEGDLAECYRFVDDDGDEVEDDDEEE